MFCSDRLLNLTNDLYPDSKEFVDRPLLVPPDQVQQELFNAYSNGTFAQTVLNLTSIPGSDLLEWDPPDWTSRCG